MARYIKANRKVAEFLHLESDRNTVSDGNYLLWQADMLAFGPLTQLSETLVQIGGIALLAHEAKEEQDGTVCRPLPVPADPRFIIEEPEPKQEAEPVNDPESEATEETAGDQSESEATEETAGDQSESEATEETAGDQSESETGDNENGGEQETIEAGDVGNAEDLLGGDQPEGETQENNENENDE